MASDPPRRPAALPEAQGPRPGPSAPSAPLEPTLPYDAGAASSDPTPSERAPTRLWSPQRPAPAPPAAAPPPPAPPAAAPPPPARVAAALRAAVAALGRTFQRKPRGAGPRPPLRPQLVRWGKRLAIALAVLLAAAVIAFFLVVRHYEADLPTTAELKNYNPPQVTRFLARDGTVLGELFVERRTLVPVTEIPAVMSLAALAAEDARFYKHDGLNYLGMLRALLVNLRSAEARQGGSTITQQVVKNVLLTHERTLDRKMRELLLARRIEQELTKDQILELYLNHIYFGHGRYGVEEAARFYFGKSVRQVTLAEAALLAGLVKGPSIYSPRVNKERAEKRRAFVLGQMREKRFVPAAEIDAALAEPIRLAPEPEHSDELAPEVLAEAERALRKAVGPEARYGGYTVVTSIDPKMQAAARAAVRQNLDAYAARHGLVAPFARKKGDPAPFQGAPRDPNRAYLGVVTGADDARGALAIRVGTAQGTVDLRSERRYNPRGLPPSRFAEVGKVLRVRFAGEPEAGKLRLDLGPQGALIALDARTREIVALVGGYEGARGGLDRASHAHRQPGSTFKAIVYGYGIHARKLTAASMLETNPAALEGYKPGNYDESEGQSPKRLREALAHSVNVAAVAALRDVGPEAVVAWARELGVTSKLGADLSLALGAYEVTPREMAGAYATFAAGGVYQEPVLVTKITGPRGEALPLPARPPPRPAMTAAEAYVTTDLLTSVVEVGTAKQALALRRPIAGKTGTTNDAKDAWFVGYSTDVACAVWTGFDDATPLGGAEVGSSAALPAFIAFMDKAHAGRPATDFPEPLGIVRLPIDPETGAPAMPGQENAVEEVFLEGTEPTGVPLPDPAAIGQGILDLFKPQ
ncbi:MULTISPECIES: penicillin-binding protein 1A [Sorangium]|uniref:peptidoglycan glycosyltransferase n=1 Tax=Sorangium cellulosum TaxID=56 RepID=A0A4P2QF91_SORCE|nr:MULTISPECIES: PBP1A family penicillin-binding protein [Sorangium]AUX28517.1 penicillin-binding protein [Sorangium cellulosum]WCQ87911.1 Penicillin-binding protein 1A [Sorangium sp. Soce836]